MISRYRNFHSETFRVILTSSFGLKRSIIWAKSRTILRSREAENCGASSALVRVRLVDGRTNIPNKIDRIIFYNQNYIQTYFRGSDARWEWVSWCCGCGSVEHKFCSESYSETGKFPFPMSGELASNIIAHNDTAFYSICQSIFWQVTSSRFFDCLFNITLNLFQLWVTLQSGRLRVHRFPRSHLQHYLWQNGAIASKFFLISWVNFLTAQ